MFALCNNFVYQNVISLLHVMRWNAFHRRNLRANHAACSENSMDSTMADYLVVPTSRPVFSAFPCPSSVFSLIVLNTPWHLLVRAFIPKATTSQETNNIVIRNR
jgi:hypothetical protein